MCTLERVRPSARYDVAVIGSGISGLAASVLLRQEGFDVVCLDAHPHHHQKVGESLDWSSPGLLQRLGIAGDDLLARGIATPKQKIGSSSRVHEANKLQTATPRHAVGARPVDTRGRGAISCALRSGNSNRHSVVS